MHRCHLNSASALASQPDTSLTLGGGFDGGRLRFGGVFAAKGLPSPPTSLSVGVASTKADVAATIDVRLIGGGTVARVQRERHARAAKLQPAARRVRQTDGLVLQEHGVLQFAPHGDLSPNSQTQFARQRGRYTRA